jgi:hypothetical protein
LERVAAWLRGTALRLCTWFTPSRVRVGALNLTDLSKNLVHKCPNDTTINTGAALWIFLVFRCPVQPDKLIHNSHGLIDDTIDRSKFWSWQFYYKTSEDEAMYELVSQRFRRCITRIHGYRMLLVLRHTVWIYLLSRRSKSVPDLISMQICRIRLSRCLIGVLATMSVRHQHVSIGTKAAHRYQPFTSLQIRSLRWEP